MATSPNLPDVPDIPRRRRDEDHAKVQRLPKGKFPWPVLTLTALAALLVAIITILPRGSKTTKAPGNANVPPQSTASQVQLSQLEMVPAPVGEARTGGPVYLDALLHNAGTTTITGVEVGATFMGNDGTVKTVTAPIQNMSGAANSHALASDPIEPNESRRVRIYVDRPPTGWNHQPPEITVENVSAITP